VIVLRAPSAISGFGGWFTMGFFFFLNPFPLFKNKSFTLAPVILVYHPEEGYAQIRITE